jgi:hypothetical protein
MQTDPFEARRRGVRHLRITTATLSAAAVVGTGALAWSVADGTATAATTGQTSTDTFGTTTSTGGQFVAPSQLPGSSSSGHSHASSGGS